jgi:hypothetical protein
VENGATVGVYTVRFFNSNDQARYVTIDTELPDGGGWYDHPINGVMWVALAEKAYAVANGLGYVSSFNPNSNAYDALNSGYASWGLQAITGVAASDNLTDPGQLATAWNAGKFVVLTTVSPSNSFLVADHEYVVVGYNASTGLFELFNPWGGTTTSDLCPQDPQVYGLFSASLSFISANFVGESIGAAAAIPGNNLLQVGEPGGANSSPSATTHPEGNQVVSTSNANEANSSTQWQILGVSNGTSTRQLPPTEGSLHSSLEGDSDLSGLSGVFVG